MNNEEMPKSPWAYVCSIPKTGLPKMPVESEVVKVVSVRKIFGLLYQVFQEHYGLTEAQIKCKIRKQEIVYVRQIMSYWLKEYYGRKISLKLIGQEIHQDHTTVIHSIKEYRDRLDTDANLPFDKDDTGTKLDYTIVNNKIQNLCYLELAVTLGQAKTR